MLLEVLGQNLTIVLIMICIIIFFIPLQACGSRRSDPEISRAPFSASSRGSATVEAALLTPIFLCGVCAIISIGQLLMIEGEIQYSAAQTLRICARNQALASLYGQTYSDQTPESIFSSLYDESSLCSTMVEGGKGGVRLVLDEDQKGEDRIRLKVSYGLRVPLPIVSGYSIRKNIHLSQRVYSGYKVHGNEKEDKNPVVYVAKNGCVYHTRPDCSHICLKITDTAQIIGLMKYSSIKPCAHCIRKNVLPKQIYITASQDHYHASLSCSGLKRTIRAVPYSEVRGLRPCSRCAR